MNAGGHLTSEEVAAYLDNTLSELECARVKSHLADCDACRKEVVSVSKLLAGASRSKRRTIAFSTLAAAAALVFLLVRPSIDSKLRSDVALRGHDTASEGVSSLKAIAPAGTQTNAAGVVFVWHPAPPGGTYRLTLTDERGGKVWVASTKDTTLVLPRETSLLRNRDYHWYVDVLDADGTSATTGITSFQVLR